jgi:two-component system sensor histidine kinase NblS
VKLYSLDNIKKFNYEYQDILIQNLFYGAILLDLNLKIISINSLALKLLNWEFSNVYKTNFFFFFDDTIKNLFLKKIENLFFEINKNKPTFYTEILLKSKKIPFKTIILTIKIAFKKKKIIGFVINIRDITKEIIGNKKKSNFLSNMSHEIRTPLFNIQSFIQTLDQYLNTLNYEEIKEFLLISNKEILRLNRLVNTILDFSKISSKNIYLVSNVSLNAIFNELLKIYSIRAKQKKVKLKKEVENNLPYILGKKDLLLQVFDNLLGNALKFCNFKGSIVFRAYLVSNKNRKKVRVEVADNGIGISKKDSKHIFLQFSQIQHDTKIIYGNGIGLSIVKKILKKHDSKIWLSTDFNQGVIFFFDFPL